MTIQLHRYASLCLIHPWHKHYSRRNKGRILENWLNSAIAFVMVVEKYPVSKWVGALVWWRNLAKKGCLQIAHINTQTPTNIVVLPEWMNGYNILLFNSISPLAVIYADVHHCLVSSLVRSTTTKTLSIEQIIIVRYPLVCVFNPHSHLQVTHKSIFRGRSGEWCNLSQVSLQQLNRNNFRFWGENGDCDDFAHVLHQMQMPVCNKCNQIDLQYAAAGVVNVPQNSQSTFQCFSKNAK